MIHHDTTAEDQLHQWIEQCVIDLSLCPFASVPYRSGSVRIVVCRGESGAIETPEEYLRKIEVELNHLVDEPAIETTLVATEKALADFLDFNDFLASAEALLSQCNCGSEFQLASFHPQYRFAGVDENDAGNYTNRAPYPVVQWLRTDTVSKAVDATDTLAIPQANIEKLQQLEPAHLRKLFSWVK